MHKNAVRSFRGLGYQFTIDGLVPNLRLISLELLTIIILIHSYKRVITDTYRGYSTASEAVYGGGSGNRRYL